MLGRGDLLGDDDAEQVEFAVFDLDQGDGFGRDAVARRVGDLAAGAFPAFGGGEGVADGFVVGAAGALDAVGDQVDAVVAEGRKDALRLVAKLFLERVAELRRGWIVTVDPQVGREEDVGRPSGPATSVSSGVS